jgi:hypothetical protein
VAANGPSITASEFYSAVTDRASVVRQFGAPLSGVDLQALIGANWHQVLAGVQPAGQSCDYYVDRAAPLSRAFQLCFSTSGNLTQKVILDAATLPSG